MTAEVAESMNQVNDRVSPHSPEVEAALLAVLLLNKDAMVEVNQMVVALGLPRQASRNYL